jgi:hypothetical protein
LRDNIIQINLGTNVTDWIFIGYFSKLHTSDKKYNNIFNNLFWSVCILYSLIPHWKHSTLIKKRKNFFSHTVYKENQMRSGAKSYTRKGFLIYEEMRKLFPYMRRPLVIRCTRSPLISLYMRKTRFSF